MSAYNIKWAPLGAEEKARKLKVFREEDSMEVDMMKSVPGLYKYPLIMVDLHFFFDLRKWYWSEIFLKTDLIQLWSAPGGMSMPSDFVRGKWAERIYNFR